MFYANRGVKEPSQGWLFIHACRRAFAAHVESALHAALSDRGTAAGLPPLQWQEQTALRGHWRMDMPWQGTGVTLELLRRGLGMFPGIHVEVTCEPTAAADGARLMVVPELGTWCGQMDRVGNTVVNEIQLRRLMALPAERMRREMALLLGQPWDDVLEPLRASGERLPAPGLHAM